jgi:hypothetical protein
LQRLAGDDSFHRGRMLVEELIIAPAACEIVELVPVQKG